MVPTSSPAPEDDVPHEGRSGTPAPGTGSLGRRVWLVLGGGGLKGLAHVGAWRALQEAGVEVQGIVGTSIGALVGALVSHGAGWREMEEQARSLERRDLVRVNRRALLLNGIRQSSIFRGDILRERLEEILPAEGWDGLAIPLQMNAVVLATGRTEWFGVGARTDVSLVDSVYASAALPVLYPPAVLDGIAYVDGGTQHPLPLDRATRMGATGIVAIDVGSGETVETAAVLDQGMVGIHQRIFSIMTYRRRRDLLAQWEGPPVLYVRPRLEGYGTFDFDRIDYFLEEGYRAMQESLGQRPTVTRAP